MSGIRLSSISVAHFRGINEPITFDLSAPLTLIFAPNGTGKTTMCEASEWLLTGQVERLKDGKAFNAKVLGSKFAGKSDAPLVSADMFVSGYRKFLSRKASGGQSTALFGNDSASASAHGPNELLSLLAPAAAANEAHPVTAINLRQRWLRGTRFLSADALAALVDTDEETIERRTQVFADLLGIRHLLDAERQCEKYGDELASRLRALNQLIAQQSSEADLLEGDLANEAVSASESTISAQTEANAAAELLSSADLNRAREQSSFEQFLEALAAVCRRQTHAHGARSSAAQRVETQWSTRSTLMLSVGESSRLEEQLARSLAGIEGEGRKTAARIAELSSQRDVAMEAGRSLAEAKDSLFHLVAVLVEALFKEDALDGRPRSLSELADAYPEFRWTEAAREQRRRDLSALQADLDHQHARTDRLRLLDEDLGSPRFRQIPEEAIALLRSAAADADDRARASVVALDATAEPVARLQAAARDLLEHDHGAGVTKCPACSHDWGDTSRLRSAIEATMSAAPMFVNAARAAATDAHASSAVARERLGEALALNKRVAELEKERSGLLDSRAVFLRELSRLGLPEDTTSERVEASRRRVEVARALAEFSAAYAGLVGMLPTPPLTPDVDVSSLLDQIGAGVAARDRVIQLQLADLTKAVESATQARDQLRVNHAGTQRSLRECRDAMRQQSLELSSLSAAWEEAAPGVEWSDAALVELKDTIAHDGRRLSRAESHIEAARSAWAAESRRVRLKELRQAIQAPLDRQRRMQDRLSAAKRARAVFYEAYTTISRKQVSDLSRVVNPLFARMHANRVFDRINLGEGSDFLHWLADAGDQQLDPGKDFSQGQRQDLALALFLARARSLGGTFFMDEPIVHLDDLNRVGLLDILRATVIENSQSLNLVITTSSRALARHLIEKFANVDEVDTAAGKVSPLKVLELDGNGRSGVKLSTVYPLR